MFRESLVCVHAPSAGCRGSLAKVQGHIWVQGWVDMGSGLGGHDPPIATPTCSLGPAWSGFSSSRRQAAGCVQGALRTRGGSTGSTWPWGSLCAGAILSLRRGSSGYSEFLGLVALLGGSSSPFTPHQRCQNLGFPWCRSVLKLVPGSELLQLCRRPLGAVVLESQAGTVRSAAGSWGALGL